MHGPLCQFIPAQTWTGSRFAFPHPLPVKTTSFVTKLIDRSIDLEPGSNPLFTVVLETFTVGGMQG